MDRRIALCALALLSARVWAEDLPELPEVVISATRIPTDILDSPSFVTVITQKDIQDSGAADLSAVLAGQSGVVVNDYGPQGQSKTVSIRGSTSSQVLILMDGMRLNSSFDGYVDLSQIPVENIDHIEIVQGGSGSLWGTGAVGGVINIITKNAGAPGMTLSISNGSFIPHDGTAVTETGSSLVPASAGSLFDNQNVNFSLAGKLGDVGLTGGGSFTRAMNAFVWDDTANLGDWRQRNNAQDLAQSAYAGLQLPLLGGSFSTKGQFTHSLIGVPGSTPISPYVDATSQETQEDTSATASVSYTTDNFFSERLSLDAKGGYRYFTEYIENPVQPFAFTSTHTGNAANVDVTQKFAFSDIASAVYGGTGSYEVVDSTNLSGGNSRLSLAGFLSLPFSPTRSLTITPSIRYDYFSDFPGFLSFQIGSVLTLSDISSVHATVGSAYRVPTLSDLYWTDAYGDMGNPNLKPETSFSGELGWSLQERRIVLETAAFARLVFNQIEWVPNTQTLATQVINITESFLPGFELHGKFDLTNRFSLQADYTFIYSFLLDSENGLNYQLSDNQRVPFVPVHSLTLAIKYGDGLNEAAVETQYVSDKSVIFYDYTNLVWSNGSLAGYFLLNARYSIRPTENLTFSLKLLNILSTLYYTEWGGYPMPPFSVVTGMQLKL